MGTNAPTLPSLVKHSLEVIRDRAADLDNIRGGFIVVLKALRAEAPGEIDLITSALDALEQAMEAPLNDILEELSAIAPVEPRA